MKKNQKLPVVLTVDEASRLLSQPNILNPYGLRDRAILEIIYGAGLRVSELLSLTIESIIPAEHTLRVTGKGNKERIIPITGTIIKWYNKYLTESRPCLPGAGLNPLILFPSRSGARLSRTAIWNMVNKYTASAGIFKDTHPHTLRHSFATHFMENGADILSVRDLLGHEDISTTQIYTQLSMVHLKKTCETYHPRR